MSKNWMVSYTNGSRVGSRLGYSIFLRTCIVKILGSTVFQAEVCSIMTCARRGLEDGLVNKKILKL